MGLEDEDEDNRKFGGLQCGVSMQATSASDKDDACPDECPYFAQNLQDDQHCTYICVAADQCAVQNPNRPIAGDVETMYGDVRKICRSPMVQHCEEYDMSGADSCKICQAFYVLGEDGQCYYKFAVVLWGLLVVLIVLVVIIIVWIVDLNCRPATSLGTDKLEHGLSVRDLQKLHKAKKGDEGSRDTWPLSTNMCTTNVCGGGMMLHFNFQAAVILWALIVAFCWCSLIWFVDPALAVLGTKRFGTPRQNCILVAWGYETQQRLMWTKELFLLVVYCITFVGCLLHSIRQKRIFDVVDCESKTMQDYAIMIGGCAVVECSSTNAEQDLKLAIQAGLGEKLAQDVIGLSICWDYREQIDEVDLAVAEFIDEVEETPRHEGGEVTNMNLLSKGLFALENKLFIEEEPEKMDVLGAVLSKIQSSDRAILIMESEESRDAVLAAHEAMGLKIDEEQTVWVQRMLCEPQNLYWHHFGRSKSEKLLRLFLGLGRIGLALLVWGLFFYAPYAWSIFTWNYDNGQQPPFIYGFAFSMIVCIGNAIMYDTCDRVSNSIGFLFKDDKETCYMILYTISCTLNILLDMVTTYYTSLYIMEGLDFRTYHGTHLENVHTFHETFESYAVQRSLAESAYAYAFPSTYLIPFLLEPIMTIWLPLAFFKLIVRNHPEILRRTAEESLAAAPMELGRYADILLNMILGVLIFYFPGGYTHTLFFAMAACHVFIYAFDHWKVLRAIPTCTFANIDVDWWSQVMLAFVCSLILACNVFKSNCQDRGFCLDGASLLWICVAAFVAHFVVHVLLLIFVVPKVAGNKHVRGDHLKHISYAHMNAEEACSWFSANPVHCLRSRHVFNHQPPCLPYQAGQEHLMQVNEAIGCYFHDKKAMASQDFRGMTSMKAGMQSLTKSLGFGSKNS